MRLWYDTQADHWKQGLPLGNGRLGTVVYGGIARETWSLSEITYWSGKEERTPADSKGKEDLSAMRELFFAGKYAEGEAIASRVLQADKQNFGTNISLCDVQLSLDGEGESFERELNLDESVYRATSMEGKAVNREVFASHADNVIAARLWNDEPGGTSFTLRLEGRTTRFAVETNGAGRLVFTGQAVETMHSNGECGVMCRGAIQVVTSNGTVSTEGDTIRVTGADEAWIYCAAATDYRAADDSWQNEALLTIGQAADKGYERLRANHMEDYRSLYTRVEADFGGSNADSLPLDERIRQLAADGDDPQLFALFFQYGRYLMIAGSRSDSPLPLHLQGIWNDGEANRMAWSCDYHLDVNTEMNYYPAEAANLAECHKPLLRYIQHLAQAGEATASDFYGCEGWTAHVFSNAWGFSAPGWYFSWGLNVTGGLWIASQLRDHYEFGLDDEFLRGQAYPVLKEAARFFLDYMVIHPEKGWLVTGPSNSPENSFHVQGNRDASHALSMGPTMDQSLIRALFTFLLEVSERVGEEQEFREKLSAAIALLPPLQIGLNGQLQEWLEDYEEAQPDHRHISHLYGLYPGNEISPNRTPALSQASRVTLQARKREDGFEDVEFTLAQFAASYARLHDGESAYEHLSYLIGELCFDNLLTYSKAGIAGAETNIFVADGNFGGTSAIAEMLLQSHAGEIHLLPALPSKWASGSVKGLRARGNAEVDIVWRDGELVDAVVKAYSSVDTQLRYGDRVIPISLTPGGSYSWKASATVQEGR
ncbi:alpha-L-fucosidase 2 [Paenibacillus phyllosphaerae]|uniref:Alpha-L-fucosidase 2 n=1 Tax=Paenibacillus phyllosphaerae TaxID=274593 RepID=A0A7W5B0M4_9BACL|nr:glycoside hydrolase family 95 protein [Paenibacillus phyllosphaerae]MBB3111721.1 alpha-L-fucosidase 2 [Paenibacillus phyllosphaerae]